MPIPCPSWQWPLVLDERGPAEDPTILLTGMAHLGALPIQIVAIRIDPNSGRLPDYKSGIPRVAYADSSLDVALEVLLDGLDYIASELDELLADGQPGTIELAGGAYRLCALPVSFKT